MPIGRRVSNQFESFWQGNGWSLSCQGQCKVIPISTWEEEKIFNNTSMIVLFCKKSWHQITSPHTLPLLVFLMVLSPSFILQFFTFWQCQVVTCERFHTFTPSRVSVAFFHVPLRYKGLQEFLSTEIPSKLTSLIRNHSLTEGLRRWQGVGLERKPANTRPKV